MFFLSLHSWPLITRCAAVFRDEIVMIIIIRFYGRYQSPLSSLCSVMLATFLMQFFTYMIIIITPVLCGYVDTPSCVNQDHAVFI